MQQQLEVFPAARFTALQKKRESRCYEINGQENNEEERQLLKTARVRTFRMEVAFQYELQCPKDKHQVNERREQRQDDLKDNNVGQSDPAQAATLTDCLSMFPHGLQNPK